MRVVPFLLIVAAPLSGQSLTPAAFRGGSIPIGTDSAQSIVTDSDGKSRIVGNTTWTVSRSSVDGRDAYLLVVGRTSGYESLIDASTHAAIASKYSTPRDSFDVRIVDRVATGTITWGGQPRRPVADTFPSPVFLGVAVDHLLGAFPLRDGFETVIPMYSPWSRDMDTKLRVLRSERLTYRGQDVDTWVVELSLARRDGPNANVRTFWLDKQTGRRLKRESLAANGSRVVQLTW